MSGRPVAASDALKSSPRRFTLKALLHMITMICVLCAACAQMGSPTGGGALFLLSAYLMFVGLRGGAVWILIGGGFLVFAMFQIVRLVAYGIPYNF